MRSTATPAGLLLAVCAAALSAASCGADERAVTQALERYLAATAAGDGPRACALLSDSGRRDLLASVRGARNCPEAIATYSAGLTPRQRADLRRAEITSVEVSGSRATASVKGGESGELERAGREWRVSGRR